MIDACRKFGIERFHQIGTDEVYGDLPLDHLDLFFHEDTPIHTSSPYSTSKASADLLVQTYHRTYGLPVTISRCSNNYGPSPEFIFKQRYVEITEKSLEVLGWPLFLKLSEDDTHNYTGVRIPFRESQEEFDGLVLALVKVLIDSLNEKEIVKRIHNKEDLKGGISKLERWFEESKLQGYENQIGFLRNLQELRSTGTGHRKGKSYEKISVVFGIEDNNFKNVFSQILTNATAFLQFIDDNMKTLKGEAEA